MSRPCSWRGRSALCVLLALTGVTSPLARAATDPWPSELLPVELRCEYLEDPLGIDVREPRLSWRLAAEVRQTPSRNQRQTAYRILVASSEWRLERDEGDVWDSGFVESDQSIQVRYAGRELVSGRPYFWKVRVLDRHGWMSAWSAPASWSMGLLEPEDFEAQWIGHPEDPGDAGPLPARYVRHEFRLASGVRRATAYVCGLGFFKLFANGQQVGDHAMDPALSNYDRRAFYVTFDLTDHLRYGSNAVGVVLGNGRFHAPRGGWMGRFFGNPRLWLQIDIELADGTHQRLISDDQWRITDQGPVRANNEYDGEVYDARLALPGWDEPGFDATAWPAAVVRPAPGGVLQSQMIEPMRVTERLRPVAITPSPVEGRWLVDFGQNFYGTVRVRAEGERGDEIRMTSAYSLRADGTLRTEDNRGAQNTDVFILSGDGVEEWHSSFRGQGLRRVEVSGFREAPRPEQFEGLVVHTDVWDAGGFACSNDLVNRIQSNLRWGLRAYLRSVPMDPDRDERQGWNGDQAKVSESAAYNFDVAAFYAKWIDDHRHDQREDGQLPVVTPELQSQWFPEVVWPSTFTLIPEMLLTFYGELDLIERHYTAIRAFVDYGHGLKNADGFIPGAVFGDWVDASCMGETRRREDRYGREQRWETGSTDGGLLSTAYQYRNERTLARYATLLGKPEDAATYGAQADRTRTVFHAEFFDPDAGAYLGGTQTGQAVALAFGLVPDEKRQQVIDFLVHDIETVHGGHLSVGLVGHQWLLQVLTDAGHVETAYTLLTRTGQPSWGYMVEQGATTIWERWDTDTRDADMNSENLLIQVGDLGAWLYRSLAGIRGDPDQPGFKHFFIQPHPVGDLRWVKAHHDSPHGLIVSNWARDEDTLTMEIVVPANTTATVHVPVLEAARVTESGVPASQAEGVTFVRADEDVAVYTVGSGVYRFVSHRRQDATP